MLYKSRIDRIDILKGIGIILVLLGHSSIGDIPHMVIYNCHMPLFFFASGFFYKPRAFKEELLLSFKRIIIPYFFFLLLWSIENILLAIISGSFISFSEYSTNYNVWDEDCSFLYASIWFLLALFYVRLLSCFLFPLIKSNVLIAIICFSLYLLGYYLGITHKNIPLFIDTSISVTVYYCLGYLIRKTDFYKKRVNWWFYCLLLALFIVICIYLRPEVDLKKNVFPLYSLVIASIGIYGLYQLSYGLERHDSIVSKALRYLGGISLTLFGLHRLFFKVFSIIISRLGVQCVFINVLIVVITILCIIPIDRLMNKYCPFLLGKTKT